MTLERDVTAGRRALWRSRTYRDLHPVRDHDDARPARTVCSRCGGRDRLRQFDVGSWIFTGVGRPPTWAPRALCYRCDNLEFAYGGRPRPGLRALLDRLRYQVAGR